MQRIESRPYRPIQRVWVGRARIRAGVVELTGAVGPWEPGCADVARILLQRPDQSAQWISVGSTEMTLGELQEELGNVTLIAAGEGVATPSLSGNDVTVSIAVCTRGRTEKLHDCLGRLVEASADAVEVLVVDNNDDSQESLRWSVESLGGKFKYVRASEKGLSKARNVAVHHAIGDVVAFTDDDALVEPDWIEGIRRGFRRRSDVALVTGLVAPAAISSDVEALFEARVKWSENLVPRTFLMRDRASYDWAFPYAAGNLGTGANFAIRRKLAAALGGFDELLGAGSACRSGEDFRMFIQVALAGYGIAYEPSAVVWHHHRADMGSLSTQVRGYGAGMAACFISLACDGNAYGLLGGVLRGAGALFRRRSREAQSGMPAQLVLAELVGVVEGSVLYLVGRLFSTMSGRAVRPVSAAAR